MEIIDCSYLYYLFPDFKWGGKKNETLDLDPTITNF